MAATIPHSDSHDPEASWKDRIGSWTMYAAAAGATLASASSAEANIIYSVAQPPIEARFAQQPSYGANVAVTSPFTVRGARLALYVKHSACYCSAPPAVVAGLRATAALRLFINAGGGGLSRFYAGVPIRKRSFLIGGAGFAYGRDVLHFAGSERGQFHPNDPGFAGFLTAGGDLGWVRIEVLGESGGFPEGIEAIDWAYNNVPGAPIKAGEGAPISTPEPGSISLALLATGAAGLLAWRKRCKAMRTEKRA